MFNYLLLIIVFYFIYNRTFRKLKAYKNRKQKYV